MTSSDAESRSWWQVIKSCSGTEIDRRNEYRFSAWTLAWAMSYVAASWTLKADLDLATPAAWFLVAVPNLIGIVVVLAFLRFLRMTDELLRKIQLEGLALGFAAGVLVTAGYQLAEAAGAPQLETDYIIVVMIFSWTIGQLLGIWRYR
ncbi:MAG: hypothetical protein GWP02_02650 [Desulfobulbaceae bacterium]|nr:hypothetical protein [Desulfobulbaceae bacterium]